MSTSLAGIATPKLRQAGLILAAISLCHAINDLLQSLLPAIYPVLKAAHHLSFGQIGAITLANQATASILQPLVGFVADRQRMPYALPLGMGFTLLGLLALSRAENYAALVGSVALVGVGSAIFHPESSRVARLASGGRHGFAQSVFQVGGNAGASLGPLLAAFVVVPGGQGAIAWFALAALVGIALLARVADWYGHAARVTTQSGTVRPHGLSRARVRVTFLLLIVLTLSKFFYISSLSNFFTFYLIERFQLSVRDAQYCLFVFLASVAAGTVLGGPIGDRIGRRRVIWLSIFGVLPFALALPHVGLVATVGLAVPIGFLLASAFPAIVVYGQELFPGHVGTVAGLFFGLAFGLGGIAAASLGALADRYGIETVYQICAFLPALGLVAAWLPELRARRV